MATAKAKTTKSNTAMVYNPARKLTVGGASRAANPVKKRKRRTNPTTVKKVVNASSHRRRRARRNPANFSGLIMAALVAGGGVFLFDILTNRFLPTGGATMRVGVKLGGAFLFQSLVGSKIPVLGKYKNEIALVLAVSGVVDLLSLYVLPTLNNATGGLLMRPAPVQQIAAEEMGDDFYLVEEYESGEDDDEDYDY